MSAHALHLVQPHDRPQFEHDGRLHLAKNLTLHPDVLIGDGNSIVGVGMPGAGKTTLLALLLEQFGLCRIPFAAFDLEGDVKSVVPFLPRGVLATAENCPSVRDMYESGLQVVFDIETFEDRAADIITATVNGLISYAKTAPHRVPLLIGLDEAAYWLPQSTRGCDHLDRGQLKALFQTFHQLAIRGRKMGLVPLLFTQRFANVHNDVLSPGTYIIMRQALDNDIERCMEYINASAFGKGNEDLTKAQIKEDISTFEKGQAIVKFPTGRQGLFQFNNRVSPHLSHAPKTQAALDLYQDAPFDPNARYGAYQGEIEITVTSGVHPQVTLLHRMEDMPTSEGKGFTIKEQIFALLSDDPDLTSKELADQTGAYSLTVRRYRTEYFFQHPELKRALTRKDLLFALLDDNPELTSKELAEESGYSVVTVNRYRIEYFLQHPELKRAPTVKEQIFALLDDNPELTPKELAVQTGQLMNTVKGYYTQYFIQHPKPQRAPTRKEQVFALISDNPELTPKELAVQTGYPMSTVINYRIEYILQHPDSRHASGKQP